MRVVETPIIPIEMPKLTAGLSKGKIKNGGTVD